MSAQPVSKVPMKGWVTTFAGTTINLCLGILYAWSIWKKALVNVDKAGEVMTGMNAGWTYLTNAQAATPFAICVVLFALLMIPGGRIQDKFGPKVGATAGGLFLAAGCILAGLMKSQLGLILGFGVLGGIGMGLGYAAPTPAALKWFGPHKRGLIAGTVVAGYGGAAIYIGGLGQYFMDNYGITGSFVGLGIIFAVVCILCGQLLFTPPKDYAPPVPKNVNIKSTQNSTKHDWTPKEIFKSWQFYALVLMFTISTQSGLLIIANAAGLLKKAAADVPFLAANALDPGILWRPDQCFWTGGNRILFRQDRSGECLLSELRNFRRVYVYPPLCDRRTEYRIVVPGCWGRLLAVWRRSFSDAVLHRRLLWIQIPWVQLWIGLHRLGPWASL